LAGWLRAVIKPDSGESYDKDMLEGVLASRRGYTRQEMYHLFQGIFPKRRISPQSVSMVCK